MNALALALSVIVGSDPVIEKPSGLPPATESVVISETVASECTDVLCGVERKRFQSDHDFDGFINPLTDVILAKDPRSNTWARFLFVNNNFPGSQAFQGGNAQVYALQVNVALTERLAFIADKDGIARVNPRAGDDSSGLLNIAAGLKYTWYRDVESQTLSAIGFQYEPPTGEASVFQGAGDGTWYLFMANAKEFGSWHLISNHGYLFPNDFNDQSSFFYNAFHIDRQFGMFYPLLEFNWYKYVTEGNALPAAVGEGEGLLNLGSAGVAGKDLVTFTAGAKLQPSSHVTLGAGYTIPLTDYTGILNNRIVVEAILRY